MEMDEETQKLGKNKKFERKHCREMMAHTSLCYGRGMCKKRRNGKIRESEKGSEGK